MKYSKINGSLDIISDLRYQQYLARKADKWESLIWKLAIKNIDENWENLIIFAKTGKPTYLYDKKYRM